MENAANNLRVAQVFSARLVLEVFGGGGAIWGFSEVVRLRRPETQYIWRINALVVSALFFIRFLLQLLDYIRQKSNDKFIFQRLAQIFSARLILEVFGGAGAIWGPAEAVKLRNEATIYSFRVLSCIAGVIFLIRYCMQMSDFVKQMKGQRLPAIDPMVQFWNIFSVKLVLEVFGSAGAVWGYSEVLTLRNPMTQELWRFNALTVGFIFLVRYCLQMKDFLLDIYFPDEAVVVSKEEWMQQCQAHAHDLALEVDNILLTSNLSADKRKSRRNISGCSAPGRLEMINLEGGEFAPLSTTSCSPSRMEMMPELPSLYKKTRSFSANDALSLDLQLKSGSFDDISPNGSIIPTGDSPSEINLKSQLRLQRLDVEASESVTLDDKFHDSDSKIIDWSPSSPSSTHSP